MAARQPRPGGPVRGSATGRPLMAAMDLLGRRWALRILWELRDGPLGARALQSRCDRMSSSVLVRAAARNSRNARLLTRDQAGAYLLTDLGAGLRRRLSNPSTPGPGAGRTRCRRPITRDDPGHLACFQRSMSAGSRKCGRGRYLGCLTCGKAGSGRRLVGALAAQPVQYRGGQGGPGWPSGGSACRPGSGPGAAVWSGRGRRPWPRPRAGCHARAGHRRRQPTAGKRPGTRSLPVGVVWFITCCASWPSFLPLRCGCLRVQ